MAKHLTILLIGTVVLTGCSNQEPPPRSVTEFVDNPLLLEAAMVRCSRDRAASRYDPECINAREAVGRIQAKEEALRREELEERSEAKRKALRRTQQATAEARRRAEELERQRKEAEYLAQFGVLPPSDEGNADEELPEGNVPLVVVPEAAPESSQTAPQSGTLQATDGGNAPGAAATPEEEEPADLNDIREELRRRNESGDPGDT